MKEGLPRTFYKELENELESIAHYWKENSVDLKNGGFVGQRDHYNKLVPNSNKGIILNARILWSYSAIANYSSKFDVQELMDRSFNYLNTNFRDKKNGGVYWELDAQGKPLIKKKQIYAQAFTVYGLAEYSFYTGSEAARNWAIEIFTLIETHAFDKKKNGYIEAFQENWSPLKDMRLSDKDQNVAKTMNTHLHILEAYTSLYKIYPDVSVKKALENLVELFLNKFLNKDNNFELFFDENWKLMSNVISFGHDIEAMWLLIEAAKTSGNTHLLEKTRAIAVPVADKFIEQGYIKGKGVLNEKERTSGKVDTDRHWWPQAEAMVGLYYAYSISENEKYKVILLDIWDFTKEHIIDSENGEWFFRVDQNYLPYKEEDKLGMWKCPYHNSRACIVLLNKHN